MAQYKEVHLKKGFLHYGATREFFSVEQDDVEKINAVEQGADVYMENGESYFVPTNNIAVANYGDDQ